MPNSLDGSLVGWVATCFWLSSVLIVRGGSTHRFRDGTNDVLGTTGPRQMMTM